MIRIFTPSRARVVELGDVAPDLPLMFRDVVHQQIVDHERRGLHAPARVLARALGREILVAQASQRLGGAPHRFADIGDDVVEPMRRGVGNGGEARGVGVVAAPRLARAAHDPQRLAGPERHEFPDVTEVVHHRPHALGGNPMNEFGGELLHLRQDFVGRRGQLSAAAMPRVCGSGTVTVLTEQL